MARRSTLAVLVLVLLLLPSCGGGAGSDDDSSVGDGVGATRSTVGDAGGDGGDGSPPDGTAKGGSGTTGKGGSRPSGSGGTTGATTKSGAPVKVGAAPGVYQYTRKGTSSVSGAYTASKPVDTSYTATVEASSGTDQRTVFTGSSPEEEQTLRYTEAGTDLVHMVIDFSGGRRREFKPNPAVRTVPKTAPAGTTWSYTLTSTDGSTTIGVVSKIIGPERITAGGKTVDTVVLEVKSDTKTPELTRTETRKIWWAPKYNLMVKSHEVAAGDQAGFHVESESDTAIRSLDP